MNLSSALAWAAQTLSSSSDSARLDAEILLAEILCCSRAHLIADRECLLAEDQISAFQQAIARRQQGEPLAYILGHKEFWSLDLRVTADTLVPRPETELLVELLLDRFPQDEISRRVADLGTGSGAIALALQSARPNWEIYATDQSVAALAVAKQNAQALGMSSLRFLQGRWCQALPDLLFDVLVSNPPYLSEHDLQVAAPELRFEPQSALVSGPDGFQDLSEIISTAKTHLKAGGYLLLEHGHTQAAALRNIFQKAGYTDINSYQDLAAQERVTGGCTAIK